MYRNWSVLTWVLTTHGPRTLMFGEVPVPLKWDLAIFKV